MNRASRIAFTAATVAAVVLAGAWFAFRRSTPQALMEPQSHTEAGAKAAVVGEVWYFGTGPIRVKAGQTIRFENAEILGVPDGMQVIEVRLRSSADPGGPVGALPENLYRNHTHTYTDLPSPPVVGGIRHPYWEFIFGLRITRPGQFKTSGVRVRYREGRRSNHRDFPYAFYMNTA